MKKTVIIVVSVLLCAVCATVIGQKKILSPKEERREVREKRRAERIADFEKTMDSVILSRNFQFNPQTMRRQPQNGNMDLNGVRSANGRHQIARPCGNDQLVQFIERPCRSNRLDRTGAREKPGARRLQTSRMQRENHRDRRPYRIFHPFPHKVPKTITAQI